jgi:cell shape-determining protein MreC
LKTGQVIGSAKAAVPILKEGDLLVTSGLDGVFPPGLMVGVVSWINSLKEGGYAYEIEAYPAAGNLNDLQTVFIMPPMSVE